ncbi:AhpC/TSA family protein [Hymenobacter sp. ISL-91]|uniref:TlpA disulfide reductase family protein n=1 Tax=Hymenobacter sp. ISL-91 TaxID=2819151 RepID=UPI001BE55F9B|nr:TlpA disulfide reductase family protein [Hymenobacter sp. ISL-91]MBT2556696.1 AhpC/TSA family protein [Hymenobacter sp. ISL-91]
MKNLLFLSSLLLASCSAVAQNQYTIDGRVANAPDGLKVYLQDTQWPDPHMVDSTVIQNGRFMFKGKLAGPDLHRIIIDKTPKGEKTSQRNWLMSSFYLENSPISYAGNLDSLPTFYYKRDRVVAQPRITGSATENQAAALRESLAPLGKQLTAVNKQYTDEFHIPAMEGKFNTPVGIKLAKQEWALNDQLRERKMAFIKANPKSVVAYDQANYFLSGMFVDMTVKQIEELQAAVAKGWAGTPRLAAFNEKAEKAKRTAIGTKYQDFTLTTPEGKAVKLSSYVPKDKYTLLEFWASWCGPCRAEIPHLRNVYETKGKNFQIVSISFDEKDADWRKAMKEEGMVWPQLVDTRGFEGDIAKAYGILGIPFSLMLDKQGRIMRVEMRGAYLDATLQDLKI